MTTTREKVYSIHNIINFKIIDRINFLNRIFNSVNIEYKNFEMSENVSELDFVVELGKFTPKNYNCYVLDGKYYIKDDYIYFKDSYKIAKWEVEVSGLEAENTYVRVSCNPPATMIISDFVINFLIFLKLNEKGYPLIHGSCVSKGGNAYVFAAQGGGGKTTTALYSVEEGFSFLGDNFVILSKGCALSFLSSLNIFSFNLAPIVKNNMRTRKRVEFYLKYLLYKVSGLNIVTKINPTDIFPNSIDDKAKLGSIFLLIPKDSFRIKKIGREELISHLVANQMLDSVPFIKYMMMYSYVFPDSRMATHWDRYEENLKKNLSDGITIYKVEVPQKYDTDTFEEIWRVMQK